MQEVNIKKECKWLIEQLHDNEITGSYIRKKQQPTIAGMRLIKRHACGKKQQSSIAGM